MRIKRLEFNDHPNGSLWRCETLLGRYVIHYEVNGWFRFYYVEGNLSKDFDSKRTFEEAVEAANEHFANKVKELFLEED